MDEQSHSAARGTLALDDVLITEELARRPSRPPDYAAENRAMATLAETLMSNPGGLLQKVAELALQLCGADSAGISILEQEKQEKIFRWHAAAGPFTRHVGGTMPYSASPCGTVISRNQVLLFNEAERAYPTLRGVEPRIYENLLAPWEVNGQMTGTVWVIKHDPGGRFDAEDARLLSSLCRFAGAGHTLNERARFAAESERRLRAAMSIEAVGILLFTPGGRILDANAAFQRWTGYSPEELCSLDSWEQLTPPEFMEETLRSMARLAERGETPPHEKQLLRKDGSRLWALFAPVRLSGSGMDSECVNFVLDITESKRAAEALRESEERYRTLVENVRDYAIFMLDAQGVITHWTEGAERVFGYTAAEVTGNPLCALCTPEQREAAEDKQELAEAAQQGRTERELWRVRKDGERIWINEIATAIRDDAGQLVGFTKISRDRTEHKQLQDALQESEERYRLAVENMRDFAVITYDVDNRITAWNAGAEGILGYVEHEVLGQSGSIIFTEEDRAAGEVEKELVGALRRRQAPDERWHVRKNGSRFWGSGAMHAIHDETGRLRGYVKVLRDETERRQWEEELRSAKKDLEARVAERTSELRRAGDELRAEVTERLKLLDELVRAQEQERGRIARELHDDLGQHMTALLLGLSAAEEHAAADPALQSRLATLKEHANRLTADVRNLALTLRPPVLDKFGLRAAVLDHLEDWSERTQVPFDVQWGLPHTERLSPATETTIYRIVQEALTNVARHARALRVGVAVWRLEGFVHLMIEDDGKGFDVENVLSSGSPRHLGLVGMRERAALLGGSLTIESKPGQGTSVLCRLPITPAGDPELEKPWDR